MQPQQLVEVAALIAGQGPVLLKLAPRCSESGLEQYWLASKCRLDRWGRALKQFTDELSEPGVRWPLWSTAQGLFEEILASEVLTRVWTGLGCALDTQLGTRDIGPIVRGVYIGHLEARNRVLNLMLRGQGFGVEAAVLLNRLRHRIERWTDLLLAHLHIAGDVREFAFDAERVVEFAEDIEHEQLTPGGGIAWQMTLTSLRSALGRGLAGRVENTELHERIAAGILSCFDSDVFDATGLFKSLWLVRMAHTARDTQGMIDLLLEEEQTPPRVVPLPKRRF